MRIATLVTAGLALLGTPTFAQNVTYDYDKAADFSKFKTYAWVRGTNLDDEINHKRIVDAIDAQLTSKGFAKVETSANPDVLVAYHATFDRDLRINGFSSGWGGWTTVTPRLPRPKRGIATRPSSNAPGTSRPMAMPGYPIRSGASPPGPVSTASTPSRSGYSTHRIWTATSTATA